jgi:hypothetical protein
MLFMVWWITGVTEGGEAGLEIEWQEAGLKCLRGVDLDCAQAELGRTVNGMGGRGVKGKRHCVLSPLACWPP